MGGFFRLAGAITITPAVAVRRHSIERARIALAARNASNDNLLGLDPKLLAIGLQVAPTIGWRKLAALGAVGIIAVGLAREWSGRDSGDPDAGQPPADGEIVSTP